MRNPHCSRFCYSLLSRRQRKSVWTGQDIREYDIEQYRNLFSVVNLEIYLFEDTVWNNLTLGKEMDRKGVDSLREKMGMQKFLNKLP